MERREENSYRPKEQIYIPNSAWKRLAIIIKILTIDLKVQDKLSSLVDNENEA